MRRLRNRNSPDALWDVERNGTSLDRFHAIHLPNESTGGILLPHPDRLHWSHWQGSAAAHRQRVADERQARERFTQRTGIALFDGIPMAEVARMSR